jgi:hypothetical protein
VFSQRNESGLTPNRPSQALARARVERRALFDLTLSNPTCAELPYAEREILASLSDERALQYEPDARGLRPAREALSAHYGARGFSVAPDELVLTASTSEAYSFVFKLLCDPGDEVLVPEPSYPLFAHLAALDAVRTVPYRLVYDGRWHIDIASLRSLRGPRVRAILVVHPNNPTGSYLSKSELAELAKIGLPIVSDEVFSEYPLRPDLARALSALEASAPLVLVLDGLSKLAALPQLKLAWIAVGGAAAAKREALARLELIADTYLSVGTPVQLALPRLLEHRAVTANAIRARLAKNHAALAALLRGSVATPLYVEGGWYAVVRLPTDIDEEELVVRLIDEDGVVVQPGYFFDIVEPRTVVVSLLTDEASFAEGVRRFAERVARCVDE